VHDVKEFIMVWTECPRKHGMVYDQCWFAKSGNCCYSFQKFFDSWKHIIGFNYPPMPTRDDDDRDRLDLPIAFLGTSPGPWGGIKTLLVLCKKYGYNLYQEYDTITNGGQKTRHPWTERRISLLVFKPGADVPPWVNTTGEFLYKVPEPEGFGTGEPLRKKDAQPHLSAENQKGSPVQDTSKPFNLVPIISKIYKDRYKQLPLF
jgi:hypothetical protein